MAFDELLPWIWALLQWRVLVCLLASLGVAFLVSLTDLASTAQAVVIGLSGSIPGVWWQERIGAQPLSDAAREADAPRGVRPSEHAAADPPAQRTSWGVGVASGGLLGLGWGLVSAGAWSHVALGAMLAAALGAGWWRVATGRKRWFSPQDARLVVGSAWLGYGAAAIGATWLGP